MNKRIRKYTGVIVGAILLALAPYATAKAEENSDVVQALYQKAKAEGEVIIWGPTVAELAWIEPAISKRFPGIKVKFNADLRSAPKIIAEGRAGKTSLDVFVFSLGGVLAIQRRNLLGTTDWKAFGTDKKSTYFAG
jgi:hypothetical protein